MANENLLNEVENLLQETIKIIQKEPKKKEEKKSNLTKSKKHNKKTENSKSKKIENSQKEKPGRKTIKSMNIINLKSPNQKISKMASLDYITKDLAIRNPTLKKTEVPEIVDWDQDIDFSQNRFLLHPINQFQPKIQRSKNRTAISIDQSSPNFKITHSNRHVSTNLLNWKEDDVDFSFEFGNTSNDNFIDSFEKKKLNENQKNDEKPILQTNQGNKLSEIKEKLKSYQEKDSPTKSLSKKHPKLKKRPSLVRYGSNPMMLRVYKGMKFNSIKGCWENTSINEQEEIDWGDSDEIQPNPQIRVSNFGNSNNIFFLTDFQKRKLSFLEKNHKNQLKGWIGKNSLSNSDKNSSAILNMALLYIVVSSKRNSN